MAMHILADSTAGSSAASCGRRIHFGAAGQWLCDLVEVASRKWDGGGPRACFGRGPRGGLVDRAQIVAGDRG